MENGDSPQGSQQTDRSNFGPTDKRFSVRDDAFFFIDAEFHEICWVRLFLLKDSRVIF